jgi:hypothetical protein
MFSSVIDFGPYAAAAELPISVKGDPCMFSSLIRTYNLCLPSRSAL